VVVFSLHESLFFLGNMLMLRLLLLVGCGGGGGGARGRRGRRYSFFSPSLFRFSITFKAGWAPSEFSRVHALAFLVIAFLGCHNG